MDAHYPHMLMEGTERKSKTVHICCRIVASFSRHMQCQTRKAMTIDNRTKCFLWFWRKTNWRNTNLARSNDIHSTTVFTVSCRWQVIRYISCGWSDSRSVGYTLFLVLSDSNLGKVNNVQMMWRQWKVSHMQYEKPLYLCHSRLCSER